MIKKCITLNIVVLFFSCINILNAQETISSSGGNTSSSGGEVAYSIGQTVYSSSLNTNFSVTQGVQQPYEISVISGITNNIYGNLEISIYPNPASELVIVKTNTLHTSLSFQLYDMFGRLIKDMKFQNEQATVDISGLEQSTYILKIIKNKEEIKTFKIIKN